MGTYTGSDKRLRYLFQNGGGGGGTTVIANPQGQATDTLNKLQVGSTIYGISSGEGGSFEETLLVENTNFASAAGTANISKTYTLSDSLDNYDAVIVYGFMYNVNTNIDNNRSNLISMMVFQSDFYDTAISQGQPATNPFLLNGSLNSARRSLAFQFPDVTHITTTALRTEAYVEPILYKVVGLKFGGGHIYSTNEQVIGKWTDGKPLYEKTYNFSISDLINGTINSSLMDGQLHLDQIPYDMIKIANGDILMGSGTSGTIVSNPINYPSGSTYIRANVQKQSGVNGGYPFIYLNMSYAVGSQFYTNRNLITFAITMQYTKTTD